MNPGIGHNNPMWVLSKVCAGDVYRDRITGPYPVYRVHHVQAEFEETCCDAVYALEDTGQVVLDGDRVIPTGEGERTHAGQSMGCRTCPQHAATPAPVQFQAA